MTFLLGRQAILGHEPPIYFRSITATRLPCLPRVQARYFDPSPVPIITISYCSVSIMLFCVRERSEGMLEWKRQRRRRAFPARNARSPGIEPSRLGCLVGMPRRQAE